MSLFEKVNRKYTCCALSSNIEEDGCVNDKFQLYPIKDLSQIDFQKTQTKEIIIVKKSHNNLY